MANVACKVWMKRIATTIALVLVAAFVDVSIFGETEVRLDSGDRRRRGFVFWFPDYRLPAEDRDRMITAAKDMGIPAHWHRVMRRARSSPDAARWAWASATAFWLKEEPGLGRLMHRAFADYFLDEANHAMFPRISQIIFAVTRDDREARIDEDRFIGNSGIALEIEKLGYVPRPGGKLSWLISISPPANTEPPPVQIEVLVDSVTRGEGSKYSWQQAHVVEIIKGTSGTTTIGPTLDFAHLNTVEDVPDQRCVLYLELVKGPPPWWRLVRFEPR